MSAAKTSAYETGGHCRDGRGGEIIKMGYLRKLKTMRKRFFILRGDSSEASARLEYYEDEKKWKKNHCPRRAISLKTCFNINQRQDTKHKHVIALYTKDDCFGLVLASEEELKDWLKALLSLQYGEGVTDGEEPKPTFEHVWQVTLLNKGLGSTRNILGRHLLCLTDRSLSLVKLNQEERAYTYEFSLASIRRCGRSDCFFYMEVGRSSCTGEGDLWMQTEDTNIADNMYAVILHAMSGKGSKEQQVTCTRSSSTNKVSKPIAMLQRRQTHSGHNSAKEAAPPASSGINAVSAKELDSHGLPQQGSGRERSDSVPSRTRTISDGSHPLTNPHTSRSLVPNCGSSRPHSVCWPAGSPVSPASGPCSTDSPGSSLSIDEGDGDGWGGYGHSLTPDQPVILEECFSNDVWPGTASLLLPVRKFSPSQLPSNITAGYTGQDAYSPQGSSPQDPLEGYMNMLQHTPGKDGSTCQNTPTSCNHSRASSLAEETSNGYVPMAPVDMDPVERYHSEDYTHGEMSPASSCSVTSGTPSTDVRFSEYHLEKVSSYFTPEEVKMSSMDRPTRAYSVGSRPEVTKRCNRVEITNQADSSRQRAFSVGSRTVNKLNSRTLAYDLYMTHQHPMLTPPHYLGRHHLTTASTAGGKKSLSAPLLCNSWSGSGISRQNARGSSHSSVKPMEDLMEMDFTRNSRGRPKLSRGGSKLEDRPSVIDGYVDMSLHSTCARQADVKAASPPKSVIPTVSPKTGDYHAQRQPISTAAKLTSSVSPKTAGPYLEMRPGSSPPTKCSVAQRKTSTVQSPFPEIKVLNNQPTSAGFCNSSQNFSNVSPYMEIKNDVYQHGALVNSGCQSRKPTSPIEEEYMDMSKPGSVSSVENYRRVSGVIHTAPVDTPQPKKAPEGYMEMAWRGGSKPSHHLPVEAYRSNSEDYMNLSFEGNENSRRNCTGQYTSQPIAIQACEVEAGIAAGKPQSSSNSPVFSLSGLVDRKHSADTPTKVPPPASLPLSNTSSTSPGSSPTCSLRHNNILKTTRQDSVENNGLATPTGSTGTIFPFSLNSPGSPMKPFPGQQQNKSQVPSLATAPGTELNYEFSRKCLVDATGGTIRLSYPEVSCSPESTPIIPDSSISTCEHPTDLQNDLNKDASPGKHSYMNYSPPHRSKEDPVYGEYAPMRPVPVTSRKISAPARVINLKTDSTDPPTIPDYKSLSPKPPNTAMFCVSDQASTPKVVTSSATAPNKEAVQFGQQNVTGCGSKVGRVVTTARQLPGSSTRSAEANNGGSISRQPSGSSLGSAEEAVSRQFSGSSVESVVTVPAAAVAGSSPTSSRPPSVSSERELHYASLDLAPSSSEGEDGSRSPHTIKTQGSLTESSTSSPSPNPISQGTGELAFTYAEIDFGKSEGLRTYSLSRKVRH